jgi:hypothetical protein
VVEEEKFWTRKIEMKIRPISREVIELRIEESWSGTADKKNCLSFPLFSSPPLHPSASTPSSNDLKYGTKVLDSAHR